MAREKTLPRRVLDVIGSFGLCCVCLFLLFWLTVFGTIFQVDHGLYAAKKTFFAWDFAPIELGGRTWLYLPGVATVLAVLTTNLFVGGLLRIKWRKRNAGVIIVHLGIVFLLLAGLVKMTRGKEGHLRLWEGDRLDYFSSFELWEVAVWELRPGQQGVELVIPDEHFSDLSREGQRTFTSPHLPFDLVLSGFVKNCDVLPKGPNWEATGPVVDGWGLLEKTPNKEAEFDVAGLHARVLVDGAEPAQGILHGLQRQPWVVEADARRFAVDLRHRRYPMPFEIRLEKFTKEDHPGMTMAKSYESVVTRIDSSGEERILIQMNEPLRQDGVVLFQSSYGPQLPGGAVPPGERLYSVFSAVDNPSDKWPEYSMWVIAAGLLIAFGRTLLDYVRKQNAQRQKLSAQPPSA